MTVSPQSSSPGVFKPQLNNIHGNQDLLEQECAELARCVLNLSLFFMTATPDSTLHPQVGPSPRPRGARTCTRRVTVVLSPQAGVQKRPAPQPLTKGGM